MKGFILILVLLAMLLAKRLDFGFDVQKGITETKEGKARVRGKGREEGRKGDLWSLECDTLNCGRRIGWGFRRSVIRACLTHLRVIKRSESVMLAGVSASALKIALESSSAKITSRRNVNIANDTMNSTWEKRAREH